MAAPVPLRPCCGLLYRLPYPAVPQEAEEFREEAARLQEALDSKSSTERSQLDLLQARRAVGVWVGGRADELRRAGYATLHPQGSKFFAAPPARPCNVLIDQAQSATNHPRPAPLPPPFLQKRAEQAAALRAAAAADYADVSSQLQAERFRVETLKVGTPAAKGGGHRSRQSPRIGQMQLWAAPSGGRPLGPPQPAQSRVAAESVRPSPLPLVQKQAAQAATERAEGAEAGALYAQLADQLEQEHERVAALEVGRRVFPACRCKLARLFGACSPAGCLPPLALTLLPLPLALL